MQNGFVATLVASALAGAVPSIVSQAADSDRSAAIGFSDEAVFAGGHRTPVLQRTKKGTTLLFATRRGGGDLGPHDLVLRRSTDDGKTWGETISITTDGRKHRFRCANPSVIADRKTGTIWLFFDKGNLRNAENPPIRFTYSEDDGLTWAAPKKLSESERFAADLPPIRSTTTHGIQLSSGRLLATCATVPGYRPIILYSDDHGTTWRLGKPVQNGSGTTSVEYCLLERVDGTIYMNIRRAGGRRGPTSRSVAVSKDGGITWSKAAKEPQLPGPDSHAGLVRLTDKRRHKKNRILFSLPVKGGPANRTDLRVWLSYNEGKTWDLSHSKLLYEGGASYSDLIVFSDLTVGIAYETDTPKWQSIRFARFTLEWLTDRKDEIVPNGAAASGEE
jgi:sialidase-1